MKKFSNKITPLSFLVIGFTPVFFTIFFLIKQQVIRHEMKERLEKEMLHTIVVPKEEVAWFKYNKEIRVGDHLFDVKSYSEKNGMVYFIGLFDTEETALNDLMKKDTDEKKGNDLVHLFQWLQSPCLSLSFDPGIRITNDKAISFPILLNISSPFINIPTPPPQNIPI
jgi:hypothetical protein